MVGGFGYWLGWLIVVAGLALLPQALSRYQVINFSNFMISGLLALSLCLIWGYCGVLSLGQAAFFGIGGYAYGIVALNLLKSHGNTDLAFLAGVIVPMIFAAVIGSIMFFARLRDVYIAIFTLVVSLLLGTFMRQTADPSYTIGAAYLGGMNGLRPASPNDPLLPSLIFGFGDRVIELDGRSVGFYYFTLGVLVAVFLAFRWLVNSSYGYLLVGCREDLERTETFGYDVRLIQITVFCISAGGGGISRHALHGVGNLYSSRWVRGGAEHSCGYLGGGRRPQGSCSGDHRRDRAMLGYRCGCHRLAKYRCWCKAPFWSWSCCLRPTASLQRWRGLWPFLALDLSDGGPLSGGPIRSYDRRVIERP